MRNCQNRCRPCCGPNHGGGCIETIVHPTVHCRLEDRHHHQRVRNIIPVVHHQVHHHHKHHEFEVKRRFTHEHNHHEHGRGQRDWCKIGRGERRDCGEGREGRERFENAPFEQDCDQGENFFV